MLDLHHHHPMKFKIPKGTPLFNAVMEVRKRMDECDAAATALCKEVGAEQHYTDNYYLAGGIAGFRFKTKPEGWKQVGSHYRVFLPKAALKELNARISALPRMNVEEMAKVLKYKTHTGFNGQGFSLQRLPSMTFLPDVILLSTQDKNPWKGCQGIIEIMGSEYDALELAGRAAVAETEEA